MFTLRERLRYRFDNLLSRGTLALIGALAAVSVLSIAVAATLIVIVDIRADGANSAYSFAEAAWLSLTREMDPGNVANDNGWGLRAIMWTVTVFGIFILSTLIGVLSSGLDARIDHLRKGRSRVVERDHTVILGWSEQVFAIVTELIEANVSRRGKGACIVILGDKDKVEMDDAIRDKVPHTRGTRVVCRTGSVIEPNDLRLASVDSARSIIIVAPEQDGKLSDDPDVDVIKSLLAITNKSDRKEGRYHIVAEVRDPRNFEVAEMVGKDEVELVLVGDLIARIMAQTCRQSGLSVVYQELLDFGGDEIYFTEERSLAGKTYGDALFAYDECAVMGIRPRAGIPIINPPRDMPINAGDKLIVIAEDDSKIRLQPAPEPVPALFHIVADAEKKPERTLVLGWNWRAPAVINELDAYVASGSTVHVVASSTDADDALKNDCAGLKRQALSFQRGDTTDRRTLDALKVDNYDHVIVLCYGDALDAQKADAATLITLLHLRDIADKTKKHVSIVSEMLDVNNRALAEVTHADDFIVSDRIVSLLLSQISENKELNVVFKDLFSPDGSEIYLKPARNYVEIGKDMTFSTVVGAAAEKGESAIGYKLAAWGNDAARAYGVRVNPKKSAPIQFGPNDKIIVLAEE